MRGRTAAIAAAGLALGLGAVPASARPDLPDAPVAADAQQLAQWVTLSGDAQGLPFLIVDKANAKLFAFEPDGGAKGVSAILLGAARGDVSPEGIGTRRLADIPPADRITPAGRFEAARGRNLAGKDIFWLDYESALSLHSVVTTNAAERRLQRLSSPTALDNRISYGCINVPALFYDKVVRALFSAGSGIVYILPEAPEPRQGQRTSR